MAKSRQPAAHSTAFSRYEAQIQQQLHRALFAPERLQRARSNPQSPVPSPRRTGIGGKGVAIRKYQLR